MFRSVLAAAVVAAFGAMPVAAAVVDGAVTGYGPNPNNINAQFFNIGAPPFSTPTDLVCNNGNDQCTAVGNDSFQKPHLLALDELQRVAVPAGGLTLDTDVSGGTASLLAGTLVSSHTVIFDPQADKNLQGYVDFDGPILGVLISRNSQRDTDLLFGLPSVNYRSPALRGLELGNDSFLISGSRLTLDFDAQEPGDHLRVITQWQPATVPLPAALPMLGAALAALGLVSRRRRT